MADARRMGKMELFAHFADKFDMKRTQVRDLFEELLRLSEKELKRSGEFVIPGVCKLVVQRRKAREGRNPATGEPIKIPGQDRRQGAHREGSQGRRSAAQVDCRSTLVDGGSPVSFRQRAIAFVPASALPEVDCVRMPPTVTTTNSTSSSSVPAPAATSPPFAPPSSASRPRSSSGSRRSAARASTGAAFRPRPCSSTRTR